MKKLILCLAVLMCLSACEAGNFSENRTRLHNMGREDICRKNPQRCINVDGTQIDW